MSTSAGTSAGQSAPNPLERPVECRHDRRALTDDGRQMTVEGQGSHGSSTSDGHTNGPSLPADDRTPEYDDYGRKLLPPIVYDELHNERGRRVGFRVPDHERETWDALADQHANHTGIYAKAPNTKPDITAEPVQTLIVSLEPWLDFGSGLEQDMRDAYDRDPIRVTRITHSIIRGCEAQRIHSAGGVLRTKLAELKAA